MGGVPLEIQQHCLEVKSSLRGRKGGAGDELAGLFLGRALEVRMTNYPAYICLCKSSGHPF
jgi:hypothetical protein